MKQVVHRCDCYVHDLLTVHLEIKLKLKEGNKMLEINFRKAFIVFGKGNLAGIPVQSSILVSRTSLGYVVVS